MHKYWYTLVVIIAMRNLIFGYFSCCTQPFHLVRCILNDLSVLPKTKINFRLLNQTWEIPNNDLQVIIWLDFRVIWRLMKKFSKKKIVNFFLVQNSCLLEFNYSPFFNVTVGILSNNTILFTDKLKKCHPFWLSAANFSKFMSYTRYKSTELAYDARYAAAQYFKTFVRLLNFK